MRDIERGIAKFFSRFCYVFVVHFKVNFYAWLTVENRDYLFAGIEKLVGFVEVLNGIVLCYHIRPVARAMPFILEYVMAFEPYMRMAINKGIGKKIFELCFVEFAVKFVYIQKTHGIYLSHSPITIT
jgi:hypothetical protein